VLYAALFMIFFKAQIPELVASHGYKLNSDLSDRQVM
jgi:hypothetical protein